MTSQLIKIPLFLGSYHTTNIISIRKQAATPLTEQELKKERDISRPIQKANWLHNEIKWTRISEENFRFEWFQDRDLVEITAVQNSTSNILKKKCVAFFAS